jgi:hypothetical protein
MSSSSARSSAPPAPVGARRVPVRPAPPLSPPRPSCRGARRSRGTVVHLRHRRSRGAADVRNRGPWGKARRRRSRSSTSHGVARADAECRPRWHLDRICKHRPSTPAEAGAHLAGQRRWHAAFSCGVTPANSLGGHRRNPVADIAHRTRSSKRHPDIFGVDAANAGLRLAHPGCRARRSVANRALGIGSTRAPFTTDGAKRACSPVLPQIPRSRRPAAIQYRHS